MYIFIIYASDFTYIVKHTYPCYVAMCSNFTEAFCTMASTVYQNHGASNKNVLQGAASAGGSVGSHKGSFSRAGSSRNVRSSPNPNSPNTAAAAVTSVAASSAIGGGGGLGSMSFDMADEIVEDPEESSDYESGEEGGRDESSYESEVNDEFTSECKYAAQA